MKQYGVIIIIIIIIKNVHCYSDHYRENAAKALYSVKYFTVNVY